MVRQTLRVENITLTIKTSDAALTIPCNLIKFEQVLMNLISNAKDAILEYRRSLGDASYEGEITVKLRQMKDRIKVSVTDNGIGIPDDMLQTVIEPFVTTKPVGSGTGLGLSVSHGIISAAGGSIGFAQRKTGARADITMPLVGQGDSGAVTDG